MSAVFAFRLSWIGALIVLAALGAAYFVVRVIVDLARWFNDEILEDFRDRRRSKEER